MSRAGPLRPADCWDWLTAEDVARIALGAFYAACRAMQPPEGNPFVEDGAGWACRGDLRDTVAGLFQQRLNLHAITVGVLETPHSDFPALPPGMSWPGSGVPGAEPSADMGHGWPASPGAGSAAEPSARSNDAAPCPGGSHATPENPLFYCPQTAEFAPRENPEEYHPEPESTP
jgi:hypothetical protein